MVQDSWLMVVGGRVGGLGRSGLCGRWVVFIWRCHSTSFLSSSSSWWRKSWQTASTRSENWPLSTHFSATRVFILPQKPSQMRYWWRDSGARMWALRRVKGAGRRGAEGVLWPFRGGFGCFLSRFWGLASWVLRVWWCRNSLSVCLLGESIVLEIFQFQFFQFIFEGYHFSISPLFLFIYI